MASISDDQLILRARVEDTIRLCDKRQCPCFFGFLGLEEQAAVSTVLAHQLGNCFFAGGYDEAERKVLAAYPDYMEQADVVFPICALAFHYREERALTHRDFLGTLLSAGIRRDKIGDILCGRGLTVVFLWDEIAPFVCEQITKIGGEGVRIEPNYTGELPLHREYATVSETIASPRLDGVVKALLHCSREEAARLIRIGNVSLDHRPVEDVSLQIAAPCTVSVRGSGRYLVDRIGPPTKKGRLALVARKCL